MHQLEVIACTSTMLDLVVPIAVLVPPDHSPNGPACPVVTLLHGLSDSYMCWLDYTNIRQYIAATRLIVVMPHCGRSFYANGLGGQQIEEFLAVELPQFIDAQYTTIKQREGRAIGGVSMGGYGALRLGLGYSQHWSTVFSHSGAVDAPRWIDDPSNMVIFGPVDSPIRQQYRLFRMLNQLVAPIPAMHFDCGLDDFLVEENRSFHHALRQQHIPHIYRERPGGHTWRYCDENLAASLNWVCQQLNQPTRSDP